MVDGALRPRRSTRMSLASRPSLLVRIRTKIGQTNRPRQVHLGLPADRRVDHPVTDSAVLPSQHSEPLAGRGCC